MNGCMSKENDNYLSKGCSCFCHSQPNNVGGCMSCNCKPVYGTGTITITNQYDQLNEKVKFLEASLDNEIKRINNLSTDIKSLKERQDKSKYSVDYQESKPYKCPVCDGCGNTKGQIEPMPNYEFSMKYATCHSCEGNGIVWS